MKDVLKAIGKHVAQSIKSQTGTPGTHRDATLSLQSS